MTALAALQRAFQASVLAGDARIEAQLADAGSPQFPDRLRTYVDGYRARLVEALGCTYPALQATLGQDEFDRRMREYIERNPSRTFSVRHYGAGLSEHLSTGTGAAAVALADLARWEWTLADVFDAPDDAPLVAGDLAALAPDAWAGLIFRFRASLRRVRLSSNAVEHWRAANGLCAAPAVLEATQATEWVLWRRGVATMFRSLDPVEALVLDAARAGDAFGALCEQLAAVAADGDVALRAAALLRGWIDEESVAGFSPRAAAG